MGGHGSGNRWRYNKRKTLDASRRLDIRILKRHGMLQGGCFRLSWTRNGTPVADFSIRIIAGESVTVKWNDSTEKRLSEEQRVKFAHTACAFGGSRQWFVCPCCSRRMAVVVVAGGHIGCRHCLNLTYASCNEDLIDRSFRRRDKFIALLGDKTGLYLKPKGMHQQTWERLRHGYHQAERQASVWAALALGIRI